MKSHCSSMLLLLLSLVGCRAHKIAYSENDAGDLGGTDLSQKGPMDEHSDFFGEESCELVSSRGLLLSCDVHPLFQKSNTDIILLESNISKLQLHKVEDSARSAVASTTTSLASLGMAHYPGDIARQSDGMTVYVVTTALPAFVHQVLPGIQKRFKLVTGDSDSGPIEVLGRAQFNNLTNNEHLIKWFAQNAGDGESHQKFVPMPIGLDYHTLKIHSGHTWGPQITPKAQESMLFGKAKSAPAFAKRVNKGLFIGSASSPERGSIINTLSSSSFVDVKPNNLNRGAFWAECGSYKFVMSPVGHGADCHRTWEVLALGSIPVVSDRLHDLYDSNGINVVQLREGEWSQLDSPAVQQKFKDAVARHVDGVPSSMYLKYWLDKIGAKFKVRCSKYLYTLVVDDVNKANKLKQSLPPALAQENI